MSRKKSPVFPELSERAIFIGVFALGLLVWAWHSIFWWAHLEGDAPLYSIISLEVLKGKHFLMTEGQAHGGTLLIYLRALLFKLFGVSYFSAFFVNGVFVAAGAALWARFALRLWGNTAGIVMGVLGAVASERFARSACTDYFGFTIFSSGVMLTFAEAMARRKTISARACLAAGLVIGFSWYISRFSLLYLLAAGVFYLGLLDEQQRDKWIPRASKLARTRLDRAWIGVVAIGFSLSIIAFFANDRFLGINAESNLKVAMALAFALWLRHRWKNLIAALPKLALVAAGATVGLLPELIFKAMVGSKDRTTGLARWADIVPYLYEIPARIGLNFSFYHPTTLGYLGALCALGLLVLGVGRKGYLFVLFPVALCLGAWFGVHTYMHMPAQYFFPSFYPIYLAAAFAVARSKHRRTALALAALLLAVGVIDVANNALVPNEIVESKVIDAIEKTKQKWNLKEGYGQMASNYNIMWVSKGKLFLPEKERDTRFVEYQARVHAEKRVFFVSHDHTDYYGLHLPQNYRVLDRQELPYKFTIFVLERERTTRP